MVLTLPPKSRDGAAKKQLLSIVITANGKILKSEAKWKFHETRSEISKATPSIKNPHPISNSNKASFSRTYKQLIEEGKIRETVISAEKCDDSAYLKNAFFTSGDLLTRRIREKILPELYKDLIPNNKAIRSFEDFILVKSLDMQLPEFFQFKDKLIEETKKLFWSLSREYSTSAARDREYFLSFFLLYVRCCSIAFPKTVESPSRQSLFFCIKNAREKCDLSPETNIILDTIYDLYQNAFPSLIRRFLRKNVYHSYCSMSLPRGGPLHIKGHGAIEDLRSKFSQILKEYRVDPIEKKTKSGFSELSEKREQEESIIKRIFDANWCRARTISFIELNN